jgi:hypothetical protein
MFTYSPQGRHRRAAATLVNLAELHRQMAAESESSVAAAAHREAEASLRELADRQLVASVGAHPPSIPRAPGLRRSGRARSGASTSA